MKFLIRFFPLALLATSVSAVFVTPCSHFFHFDLDETNRVKSGVINLNVTAKIANLGYTMEAVFDSTTISPVNGQDIPLLSMVTEEDKIQEIIQTNGTLKYQVKYNLEKRIPKLVKIVLHGPGTGNAFGRVVCEELPDLTSNVHLRAFSNLSPIRYDRLNFTIPDIKLYTRKLWGAENPKRQAVQLNLPVKTIKFYYSGTSKCNATEECKKIVKELQRVSLDQGNDDLHFNYLIGGDGNAYEGTGLGRVVYDDNSFRMALIGPETKKTPLDLLQTLNIFALKLIAQGFVTEDYSLYSYS